MAVRGTGAGEPSSAHRVGPLEGLRVLCVAENVPGPYATLLLADMGADVLIVERPGEGDSTRRVPTMFAALARGKRSVALDLKSEAGRAEFLQLAGDCDAIVEGFRPGVADRLGVGYEQVLALSPDIIYVAISGYGQDGPYRDRPGHDINYQATAGMLRGSSPETFIADFGSGTFAALAVTSALARRERDASASYIDVSMLDVLVSWQIPLIGAQQHDLHEANTSYRIPIPFPGQGIYRTRGGAEISLGVTFEDHLWRAVTAACGLDTLADISHADRIPRTEELDGQLREAISARTLDVWEQAFDDGKIPYAVCRIPAALSADPQIAARRLIREGRVRLPLVFDGAVTDTDQPVPRLDENAGEGWITGDGRP